VLISRIRSRISNARKTYGSYARKFNSEKLKSPETFSAYREKLNECLARHVDENDDIKEAWALLKNALTQTAGTVLDSIERVTHKDWVDAECEQQQLAKAMHTKGCNKEIILGNQWRNIKLPEVKRK